MKPGTIEIVPVSQPTIIIRVDMPSETIMFEFLNAETASRLALLVLGCEMAIRKLLDSTGDTEEVPNAS